ncbi:MAG: YdjY domain-containing protein [Thermodesulfovibrionales bacterium]
MKRADILRHLTPGAVLTCLLLYAFRLIGMSAAEVGSIPTRETPLVVDAENHRLLVYGEVNQDGDNKVSTHFGVVFKGGQMSEKALITSYVSPSDFHDALLRIGARPGNNLSNESRGEYVEGKMLLVSVTWHGLGKEIPLVDFLTDSGGRGFDIRFGGNRHASESQGSGCLTCLESCWVGITSNAAYPVTSTLGRFLRPNSRFSIKEGVLPHAQGRPLILIYRTEMVE